MGILRFRNARKELIIFGRSFTEYTRGQISTKNLGVTYSNATGQSVINNEILYTYLTPGVDGYIQIKAAGDQVLNGSGILNITVTHQVSQTQLSQDVSFVLFSSPLLIQFNYNSNPEVGNVIINLQNRENYIFKISDFQDYYTDFDNDPLMQVSIYGNVTGYKINGNQYIEGDWIALTTIDADLFTYESNDQDALYVINNEWKGKDYNDNISNIGNLKITVADFIPVTCTPPILESVVRQLDTALFDLVWNYDGVDYSVQDPTTIIRIYVSSGGVSYELHPGVLPYTDTSETVDLTTKIWEIFYFKIRLTNASCDMYSNVINITI